MFLSPLTAIVLPFTSLAVWIGPSFATISANVGAFSVLSKLGAMYTSGNPCVCAAMMITTSVKPISSAPDASPAAMAFPLVNICTSMVIPAFLK